MVSVIVPVYNTDTKYIDRCLKSLSLQSDRDFEVIIIDDGSDVFYSEYLDKCDYGDNFYVIHQKNAGVSEARNNGIRSAKGEYITFVDSDDYVSPDFIASGKKLIEKYNADLVIGGISIIDGESEKNCNIKGGKEIVCHDTNAIKKYYLTAQYENSFKELKGLRCGGPWCKLYKRSVIGDLQFRKDIPVYEDMIFNLEALENAEVIVVSPDLWYNYIIYSTSAMRKYRPDGIAEQMRVTDYLAEYKERYPDVSAAIAKKTAECIKKIITSTLYHKQSDSANRLTVLKGIFKNKKISGLLDDMDLSCYPGLSRSDKLFYKLCAARRAGILHILFGVKRILNKN